MSYTFKSPFNLNDWIGEHQNLLKPPVGNIEVFPGGDFIVMAVGGPNARKDYHINQGPELFHQIQGEITLKILEDGRPKDIVISEGDIFLLPPNLPHSPQRPANTVGLVVEQKRRPDEKDGFLWVCDQCHTKLYEEFLHVSNIVAQLPKVFERFYNSSHVTCTSCGTVAKR